MNKAAGQGKKPYRKMPTTEQEKIDDTLKTLDYIAVLEPGKNAQIAAKKISQKY